MMSSQQCIYIYIYIYIYVPCTDAPRTPSGPLQTPDKPILNRKYDPRAFERRAGRLLTLTTTPWRSWESRYWVCNQGFSMVLYLDPRPSGGRDSSDTVWFSAPMSTLRDLQRVVVRVRRRPVRRWKALGPYFRLSIGFSGVWRGPVGLRGASLRGTYICTDINDSGLII